MFKVIWNVVTWDENCCDHWVYYNTARRTQFQLKYL